MKRKGKEISEASSNGSIRGSGCSADDTSSFEAKTDIIETGETDRSQPSRSSIRVSKISLDLSSLYVEDPKSNMKAYNVTMLPENEEDDTQKEAKKKEGWLKAYKAVYGFADKIDSKLMIIGLIASFLQATLPPFVWLFMGDFVTLSIQREEIKILNVSAQLEPIDETFSSSTTPAFVAMLALSISMFIAAFVQRLVWEISAIRQVFRVKKAYVRKLLHMDISWLESRQSGQVAAMLHEHADSIYAGIADHLPMIFFILNYLLVNIAVCIYIQWDVMLLMCSAIPALIGCRIIFSKWFAKTINEENRLQGKLTDLVSETFNCIRTVIAFAAQKQTINKFERISTECNKLTEARLRSSTVFDSLTQVLLTELVFTAALCYGIWRVADTSPGRLCALAINMLYMCVTSISIGFYLNGASTAKQNSKEMHKILDESPKIEVDRCTMAIHNPDKPTPMPKYRRQSMKFMGKGAIHFRDITFSYPSRPDIQVLKGINLKVEAGEKIAIVGSSGSGKSTLTALLLRFYDPTSGSILLDGDNLKSMSPDDIRAQCSLVSQEPVLFDGTISDNIRYGRLDATQQEINDAARKVGAWQFISSLPEGMQTRVGDRGIQLSGGQKQRVAIARACIRKPTVMIFDESTSALDNIHEEEVQRAIDLASEGLTTITIAHRLTTVKNADRIIVLDDGHIVEEGEPEELLAKEGGRFQKMCYDQLLRPQVNQDKPLHSIGILNALDLNDPELTTEEQVRALAKTSLIQNTRLGRSYSVQSLEKDKLALPVMSKKRSKRLNFQYTGSNWEFNKSFDEESAEMRYMERSSFSSLICLIRNYRDGYSHLFGAIPTTILRAFFYLLICFEVASVLEISVTPESGRTEHIFLVAAVYTALIIIKTMFEALGRLFIALYGHGFCTYMRNEMFRSILRHGAAYFDEEKNSPGKLTHRVINDSSTLNKIMEQKLDLLIPAFICSVFSVIVALYINWKMALLCSFQFPAYFIIRIIQIKEGSRRQRQMMEEEKKAANLTAVVLSNMSTIKAYCLQEHFYSVFVDALKPLAKAMRHQSIISSLVFACQFSFTYILIAITLYFGKLMMLANEITVFDYMRVVLLTQFGANFFSQLVASVTDFSKARIAAENVLAVMREPAMDMDNLTEEGLRPKLEGHLMLKNVSFRYPSRPIVPILNDMTLKISAGESVAFVGPSGSGKSTIISLFQRMYSPTEGFVVLDKYNAKAINPGYLRRCVVSVGQEPTLFSYTIKENIAYGLIESEATMEKVVEAAKIADIHDFITSLPQGYDTEVGEFGAQLSGGQRQRIAIARAVIRKPVVLLLDEATASLDTLTEKVVQQAFEKAGKSCTCVQIAHRLSSIRNVDRIYVVVEGQIAEMGNHDELMALRGLYFEMIQAA